MKSRVNTRVKLIKQMSNIAVLLPDLVKALCSLFSALSVEYML